MSQSAPWVVREARRRQLQVARRLAPVLVPTLSIVGLVSVAIVLFLDPPGLVAYGIGVADASLVWCAVGVIVQQSGTASTMAGAGAEDWTSYELKPITKQGWRVVRNVLRERGAGDIDHVAIGPRGVVVIETKWSARTWSLGSPFMRTTLERACTQASASARRIRSLLRKHGVKQVRPVVVLWGTTELPIEHHIGGVPVIHGADLLHWIDNAPVEMTGDEVSLFTSAVEAYATMRNQHEEKARSDNRFVEVGVTGVVADLGLGTVAGLGGFLVVALLVDTLPLLHALLAGAAVAAIGVVVRRVQRSSIVGLSWAVGSGLALTFVAAIWIGVVIRHTLW